MWVVRVALQRALQTRQRVSVIGLLLALGGGWTVSAESPLPSINLTPVPVQLITDQTRADP